MGLTPLFYSLMVVQRCLSLNKIKGIEQNRISPEIRKIVKKIKALLSTVDVGMKPTKNVNKVPIIPIDATTHIPIFPKGIL